ncbi:MAG: DUF2703 domain-containing protein [Planctomycetota bacterium]
MIKNVSILIVFSTLGGCVTTQTSSDRTLNVHWQRLVDETGQTCERCGNTQTEVRLAAKTLKRCLRPLNIDVALKETTIDPKTCALDISQSNRIFIDGRPVEGWLGGKVGMSLCGFCCQELGENVQCRTVTVDGQTHETIPAILIIRAGLLAAEASLGQAATTKACCPK